MTFFEERKQKGGVKVWRRIGETEMPSFWKKISGHSADAVKPFLVEITRLAAGVHAGLENC
jgi:hypothetical protein